MRKPLVVVLSFLFAFYACTKIETTTIGTGLIPPIDGVNVKDTFFDVITSNFVNDEIARVYNSDIHVIGYIGNDPLFGKTTASTYLELKPTDYPYYFPGNKDSLVADSAVLILSYRGVYGDSTIPQTWRVFEVSSKLRFDTTIGTASEIPVGQQLGIKSNFDIRGLDDSVNNRYENAANQIRIKLSSSFATRFIKSFDSTNAYKSDSIFRENFAGFAVVPDAQGNALINVSLLDTNTKLSLYYTTRVDASDHRDTSVANFRVNTQAFTATGGTVANVSAAANYIKRERGGAQINNYLTNGGSDSLLYIQTSPGTFATVKIPNLSKFRNVLVHRAELVALQAPFDMLDDVLSPPRYILLSAYDSVNKVKLNIPNDYVVSLSDGTNNISSFGGYLSSYQLTSGTAYKAYNFTLTRYVQGIVTRKDTSYTLRMYAPSNDSLMYRQPYPYNTNTPVAAYISPGYANNIANGRVRLYGGGKSSVTRMRLRIIYSEL